MSSLYPQVPPRTLFFSVILKPGDSNTVTPPEGMCLALTSANLVWSLPPGLDAQHPSRALPCYPFEGAGVTARYLLELTTTSCYGSPQSCVLAVLRLGGAENVQMNHFLSHHPASFFLEETPGSNGANIIPGSSASVHIAGYFYCV